MKTRLPVVQSSATRTQWQLPQMPIRQQPRLQRIYDENFPARRLVGTTGFFRNRPLLKSLLEQLDPKAVELNA